jgi:hypothetical protein
MIPHRGGVAAEIGFLVLICSSLLYLMIYTVTEKSRPMRKILAKMVTIDAEMLDAFRARRGAAEPARVLFAAAVAQELTVVVALLREAGVVKPAAVSKIPRRFDKHTWDLLENAVAETGLAPSELLRACLWRAAQTASGAPDLLDQVLRCLSTHAQRATYGAVAEVVGGEPRSFMRTRPRTHEYSWVVSKRTGRPSGFDERELDPRMRGVLSLVISDARCLRAWLQERLPPETFALLPGHTK